MTPSNDKNTPGAWVKVTVTKPVWFSVEGYVKF
jgi:hypothetical protein